jgi:hypothetical protein
MHTTNTAPTDRFCLSCLSYVTPDLAGDEIPVACSLEPTRTLDEDTCPECGHEGAFAASDRQAAEEASATCWRWHDEAARLRRVLRAVSRGEDATEELWRLTREIGVCHCGRLGELVPGGGGVAACPKHRNRFVALQKEAV